MAGNADAIMRWLHLPQRLQTKVNATCLAGRAHLRFAVRVIG